MLREWLPYVPALVLLVAIQMPETQRTELPTLAFAIKTCRAYHKTRLPAMMRAYGSRALHLVGSDAEVEGMETVATADLEVGAHEEGSSSETADGASVVGRWEGTSFVATEAAGLRGRAYVPPWRQAPSDDDGFGGGFGSGFSNGPAAHRSRELPHAGMLHQDLSLLPALTRRVAALLGALYDAHSPSIDWYVIVDDDTFVRLEPLRARLSAFRPSRPYMVGTPVDSKRFLTPSSIEKHGGSSKHCGGGNGWAISRGAMDALRPRLHECLRSDHVVISWYFDEIQLGRCLHEILGISCTEIRGMDRPFHERAPELGISEETEGDDDSLLTYHPASPEKMAELRLRFDDDDDARWARSYMVSFYWANRWLITGVTSVVLVFLTQ